MLYTAFADIMTMKVLVFTGHRPDALGGYNENNDMAQLVKSKLNEFIKSACEKEFTHFISGMAQGVDIWAAEAVIELKKEFPDIKLYAAVPFAGQYRKWLPEGQKRWREVIAQCDQVHLVNQSKIIKPDQFLESLEQLDEGVKPFWQIAKWLDERNRYMVDRATAVLAVWKGSPGGTANCVEYARKTHKPVAIYDPKSDTLEKESNEPNKSD